MENLWSTIHFNRKQYLPPMEAWVPFLRQNPFKKTWILCSKISSLNSKSSFFSSVVLVLQVGEVNKGNKGSCDDDHPWLEVDVRGFLPGTVPVLRMTMMVIHHYENNHDHLLPGVLIPIKTKTQTHTSSGCICWVVLAQLVILVLVERYPPKLIFWPNFSQCQDFGCIWTSNPPLSRVTLTLHALYSVIYGEDGEEGAKESYFAVEIWYFRQLKVKASWPQPTWWCPATWRGRQWSCWQWRRHRLQSTVSCFSSHWSVEGKWWRLHHIILQETQVSSCVVTHQETFVSVNNVEEPTEKVHDDVEERLDDDRPQLHEPGAAEALLPDQHDVEVEECEEGAKDCEGCEHWSERDIEQVLEGWAREHLGRIL